MIPAAVAAARYDMVYLLAVQRAVVVLLLSERNGLGDSAANWVCPVRSALDTGAAFAASVGARGGKVSGRYRGRRNMGILAPHMRGP